MTFWSARTGELIAEHPTPEPGVKPVRYTRYKYKSPLFESVPDGPEVSTVS